MARKGQMDSWINLVQASPQFFGQNVPNVWPLSVSLGGQYACDIPLSLAALHLNFLSTFFDINYVSCNLDLPYLSLNISDLNEGGLDVGNPHFFTCPAAAGPDQNTWLNLDYQAVGVISLYVKEDLRTAVVLTYEDPKVSLAFRTLANLATLYAMTGPTGQFYLFRDIVNWRLGGEDPSAEIAHLIKLFAQLSGVGLVLPDNLKVMLLCTGLGDNYASLVTTAVHTIGTTEFTPAKLISMILAESQ